MNKITILYKVFTAVICLALSNPSLATSLYRSFDGTGNNIANPSLGAVDTQLLRLVPSDYADNIAVPAGPQRPSARIISNHVASQSTLVPNAEGVSSMVFQWGQFLDHDIDLTETAESPESWPISVPNNDTFFLPGSVIAFMRSIYDEHTGINKPRHQLNQITSYIDASQVYGVDSVRATTLRKNDGSGELKTSRFNLLPFNTEGLPNAGGPDQNLYLAGDVRANEQVGLTAMHTLFVREHNRLASALKKSHPSLSGEEIYQRARALVGAKIQVITYKEFLPAILGPNALSPYTGYRPEVDPSISDEFSTAAFRFGHSMLSPVLHRLKRNGKPIPAGHLSLREAFFTRNELDPSIGKGIEPLLRGLAFQQAQAIDVYIIDDVRNFLFGGPNAGGADLASLNIQRGRDHGLAGYNQTRYTLGFEPAESFADVSSNIEIQSRLAAAYSHVNNIDLWVGGLAEDHVPGALVGELFYKIIKDQFERLRDGDRFWYQSQFSGDELAMLEASSLTQIIVDNTKIKYSELNANVFRVTN